MNDFIEVYEGLFPEDFCKRSIEYFDKAEKAGLAITRQQQGNIRKTSQDDLSIFSSSIASINNLLEEGIAHIFYDLFWNVAYKKYTEKYSILSEAHPHSVYHIKTQRTEVGQGYHVWHFENMRKESSTRLLTYTLYLNDVEEGGETELLYYPRRIKPTRGTLCLFPASFTHAHRGNPPLSNTKYVITGWVEY